MEIKALVVDDEPKSRRNIITLLNEYCPQIAVTGEAGSGPEAMEEIRRLAPQVLFLDIRMPGMNGFDLLNALHNREMMVVFVSAFEEYALRALKAGAIDYLLKPISIVELIEVAQKLHERWLLREAGPGRFNDYIESLRTVVDNMQRMEEDKITFSTDRGYFIENIDNIIRIESDNNYVFVHRHGKERLVLSRSLSEVERTLPGQAFFRIHNSHLINLRFLERFDKKDGGYVVLREGTKLPVSRRRVPILVKQLKEHYRLV